MQGIKRIVLQDKGNFLPLAIYADIGWAVRYVQSDAYPCVWNHYACFIYLFIYLFLEFGLCFHVTHKVECGRKSENVG